MNRPVPKTVGVGRLAVDDQSAWEGLPGWRGFFLEQVYSGTDQPRVPGVLIVTCRQQRWQWTLKDPTSATCLRLDSQSWDEGLLLAEALLCNPDAPWETDTFEAQKQKGKRRGA